MSIPSAQPSKPRRNRLHAVLVGLSAVLFIGIYAGFFVTDGEVQRAGQRLMLWTCRIGLPVGYVLLLAIWRAAARGVVRPAVLGLAVISMGLAGLILYPVASSFYHQRVLGRGLDQFHPYLQLAPAGYVPEDDAEEEGRVLRIFCLGGSTTEFKDGAGRGWPARVQERLAEQWPDVDVRVHNLGRQWYSSMHILIHYQVNLRRHHPDVIVVMEAINDLLQNADFSRFSVGSFHPDYRHFHGPIYRLIDRQTLVSEVWGQFRSIWYARPREVVDTNEFPGLSTFTNNLQCLIDQARADGAEIVLMTQPHLLKEDMTEEERGRLHMVNTEAIGRDRRWSADTARRGMNQYNQAIRDLAAARDVPLIDLEAHIPKTLDNFYDDVHYRGDAFELVAEEVARGLSGLVQDRLNDQRE